MNLGAHMIKKYEEYKGEADDISDDDKYFITI